MKSTVIHVSHERSNLEAILEETGKISAYVSLNDKQALRVRLLSEELVGMLKELSGNFDGEFWIQIENGIIELITRIYVIDNMDNKTKKGFIDVASDKKNAAAKGIMGKIRDVVENLMYPENATFASSYITSALGVDVMMGDETLGIDDPIDVVKTGNLDAENIVDGIMGEGCWSLNRYKNKQRDNAEPWDEIEKSIIANLADDVTVFVKGKCVEIRISKSF